MFNISIPIENLNIECIIVLSLLQLAKSNNISPSIDEILLNCCRFTFKTENHEFKVFL